MRRTIRHKNKNVPLPTDAERTAVELYAEIERAVDLHYSLHDMATCAALDVAEHIILSRVGLTHDGKKRGCALCEQEQP